MLHRHNISFVLILEICLLLQPCTARPKKNRDDQADSSANAVITDTTGSLLLALIDRIEVGKIKLAGSITKSTQIEIYVTQNIEGEQLSQKIKIDFLLFPK